MSRFIATLLFAGFTSTLSAQQAPPTAILPDQMQWQAAPTMPGAQSLWLIGGANQTGIYAQRVKLAQGAMIPPHVHSDERFSVVLSGTIYVGFGTEVDESQVVAVPTGGIYVAPAGVPHYVWARDGAAEYQESGVGPTATTFSATGN